MDNKISYRLAEEKDKEFLLQLRNETMNAHISNAGLTQNNTNHIERINYRFDCANIIFYNHEKIGLLKVVKEDNLWDLVQIQLVTEKQRKGIGQQIITALLREAFKENASVILTVFKSNPAKNLYSKLGFNIYLETETTYEMKATPHPCAI